MDYAIDAHNEEQEIKVRAVMRHKLLCVLRAVAAFRKWQWNDLRLDCLHCATGARNDTGAAGNAGSAEDCFMPGLCEFCQSYAGGR